MTGDRIITVSMVSDTLPNVRRWVDRTLASGVDHMLVFLDEERPDVQQMLEAHPMVTVVRTEDEYWNHDRPTPLPDRQMINANVSLTALVDVPSAGWLFHIDVDEALSFDREEFIELDLRAARFPTLEAVAKRTWPRNEPRLFKKQPTTEELYALAALGVIDEPELDSYFRGHHLGKTGVRPHLDVRFRVHSVYERPDTVIQQVKPPGMHLLHYASFSVRDFVDRWQGFDPERASGRPFRSQHVGTAFHTIRHHPGVGRFARKRLVAELFDQVIADDIKTLDSFGLLVPSPRRPPVAPRPLSSDDVRRLEAALADLYPADKAPYKSQLVQVGKRTVGSR